MIKYIVVLEDSTIFGLEEVSEELLDQADQGLIDIVRMEDSTIYSFGTWHPVKLYKQQ